MYAAARWRRHDGAQQVTTASRIVWITPKWPLPADDGARQATTQLVRGLSGRGVPIDLVALVPEHEAVSPDEALDALGLRSASIVRRPTPGYRRHLRNLLRHPGRALTLSQYATTELGRQLNQHVNGSHTLIVFDGLHSASWLQDLPEWPDTDIVYRAHNVESDLWFRAASEKPRFAGPFFRWQGAAVQRFERRLCTKATRVLTVSDDDSARLSELAPDARIATLPIGMDRKPRRLRPVDGRRLLFIGRLDWPPNRDGLKWFLERVWPHVVGDFELDIVGSGCADWLRPFLSDTRLAFHGRVESVTPHYHAAVANIVPIFYGSGTRVKAIESSLYETACISTALGVAGIGLKPGEDYVRAESESEWIEAINGLNAQAAAALGRSALERVAPRFDRDRVADRFLQLTGAHTPPPATQSRGVASSASA